MRDERLIDDIARGLTAAAPPHGLRTRVLARIAEPRRSQSARWFAPVAAAIAIGLAVTIHDRGERSLSPARSGVTPDSAPPAVTTSARVGSDTRSARRSQTPRRDHERGESPREAWGEGRLPRLDRPTPILFEAIQPVELSIAPITVDPLTTDTLAMPPVSSGTGTPYRN